MIARRWPVWSMIAVLWLVVAPVLAQTGRVHIFDPDNVLGDRSRVQQAAQQLADQGADVVVVAAGPSAGTDPRNRQATDTYFQNFLQQQNILLPGGGIKPDQIIFSVARDAQYTALRYGSRWKQVLDPVTDNIQAQQMNPRFANGDLAGGLVAGIDQVRTTINPPTSPLVYLLGALLIVGLFAAIGVPLLRRRQQAAQTLAGAQQRMVDAQRAAGSAIADLGQLVRKAQDKAQFDRVSYSAADAAQIQQTQANGEQLFQQAQAVFDAAEEAQQAKPTLAPDDYGRIAVQYTQAQQLAQQATALINEAEAQRAALDARGTPNTGPTTRL